jgi:phage baseplate assembly protein V
VAVAGLYSDAHPAPGDRADLWRKEFADGAVLEYDRAAHRLLIDTPGDVAVTAGGEATIDAPMIKCNGGAGVITQESICHFTGNPHADGSTTVTAGK